MHLEDNDTSAAAEPGELPLPHQWILSRLNRTVAEVRKGLDDFRFNDAAHSAYQFVWHEFCDWYLEWIKPDLYGDDEQARAIGRGVLLTVLEEILAIMHPMTPFVTEEIWHALPGERSSLMVAPFPVVRPERAAPAVEKEMELLMGVITGLRNIRSESGIHPSAQITVGVICPDPDQGAVITANISAILGMTRTKTLEVQSTGSRPRGAASYIYNDIEIFVALEGLVDIEQELAKLAKEKGKVETLAKKVAAKLNNEKFLANAPAEIVAKEQEKQEQLQAKLAKIEESLARLGEITH